MKEDITIGFIGFGLIAGDVAINIKEHIPTANLIALNEKYPNMKVGIPEAINDGVLDSYVNDLEGLSDCDIIFLCAPVVRNIEYIKKLKPIMKDSCILTDVGSVKNNIHKAVIEADMEKYFVGGHPMAGSEKTSYLNSTKEMLRGAFYLLTPTPKTPQDSVDTIAEIAIMCGCRTMVITPEEHDTAAAAISHVPHVLSYSLVNTVRTHDNDQQYMKQFAGGGFRDMTRIAASSPQMWQNIVLSNKESVLTFLSQYQEVLDEFTQMLIHDDEEGLMEFFKASKDYRDTFTF